MDGDPVLALLVDHPEPWTPEDLERFPESTLFEVLDGLLFVNAAPNYRHQRVADNLLQVVRGGSSSTRSPSSPTH